MMANIIGRTAHAEGWTWKNPAIESLGILPVGDLNSQITPCKNVGFINMPNWKKQEDRVKILNLDFAEIRQ